MRGGYMTYDLAKKIRMEKEEIYRLRSTTMELQEVIGIKEEEINRLKNKITDLENKLNDR